MSCGEGEERGFSKWHCHVACLGDLGSQHTSDKVSLTLDTGIDNLCGRACEALLSVQTYAIIESL